MKKGCAPGKGSGKFGKDKATPKGKKYMVLFALVGLLGLTACGDNIYIGGDNNTNNVTSPNGPTASPSPGAASCPAQGIIRSIRVNPFGYQCQPGTPVPNNSSGILPVGCVAVVTATPKDGSGADVPDNIHGPDISWSVASGAANISVVDWPGNAFNKNVTGLAPGEFRLEASLCGVTGAWSGRVIP